MNRAQANSSSESDEDQNNVAYFGAQPTGETEQHLDENCKYERYHRSVNGREVIWHIRICKCRRYQDMGYLAQCAFDLSGIDGKDIHFSKSCKWERSKARNYGGNVYVLRRFCGCNSQQTSRQYACTMNSKIVVFIFGFLTLQIN
jgi:hypothetical protein